jgi:hypothetical protein
VVNCKVWEVAVAAYMNIAPEHLSVATEETHEKRQDRLCWARLGMLNTL